MVGYHGVFEYLGWQIDFKKIFFVYIKTEFGKIKVGNFTAHYQYYGKITSHFIFTPLMHEEYISQQKLRFFLVL